MANDLLKASHEFREQLLAWYETHHRKLPWRAPPGETADPYHVWLSEVMLQQTTVKTVIPYFQDFLCRWPTLKALALSEREEILSAWAGLGYYRRAMNLHACARTVMEDYNGTFPNSEQELLKLPGIGPYTAAAIAAIAFSRPANVIDGNIERVIARYCLINTPLPAAKAEIARRASKLAPTQSAQRPGDYAQALMDLGAMICTPKAPSCGRCPVQRSCSAFAQGAAEKLPLRLKKPAKPLRRGAAFLIYRGDSLLLRRRPEQGLLAGMMEVPGTGWTSEPPSKQALLAAAPITAKFAKLRGLVRHTFTHFELELTVYRTRLPGDYDEPITQRDPRLKWIAKHELPRQALPSVMRKVIAHDQ